MTNSIARLVVVVTASAALLGVSIPSFAADIVEERVIVSPATVEHSCSPATKVIEHSTVVETNPMVTTTEKVFEQETIRSSGPSVRTVVRRSTPKRIARAKFKRHVARRPMARRTARLAYRAPVTRVVHERVIEKTIEKPVIVERPVFVEKQVVVEKPVYVNRIVEKQVVVEPQVERIIEQPVQIEQIIERPIILKKRKHLLDLQLF